MCGLSASNVITGVPALAGAVEVPLVGCLLQERATGERVTLTVSGVREFGVLVFATGDVRKKEGVATFTWEWRLKV